MKKALFYLLLIVGSIHVDAQDVHFSQYQKSFQNLNPALTGSFNGDYRFNANYRNQWASISEPYRTFSIGAEAKNLIKKYPKASIGLVALNDEAGVGGLTNTAINANIGYLIKVDADSTWIAKAGLQLGFSSRSIDFNRFTYDNQYNGRVFDAGLSSGENFERNSLAHLNLGTGFGLEHRLSSTDKIEIGFSVFNLTNPNLSFDKNAANLDNRTNFYILSTFQLAEKLSLLPSLLYSRQDRFQEFLLGSNLKYHFEGQNAFSDLYGGIFMRTGDAFIFSAGFDYHNWNLGLSYDVNFSELKTASNRRGGLEISASYIFKKFVPNLKRFKVCPNFM